MVAKTAKMKNEIEFSMDKIDVLENAIIGALKSTDDEPEGCLLQFSDKGIEITSVHPKEISAFTAFIPKSILMTYKRKLDESKETRGRSHDIWFIKDNLEHLKKMTGIKGKNLYKFTISESRISMSCTTLRKSMVIAQGDPVVIGQIKRIQGVIEKVIASMPLNFTTNMEELAFGIAAIEKLLRKSGNYSHAGSSLSIKKDSIILSIILENDEIEVLFQGKDVEIKQTEEIKEQISMVELSSATKNIKKLCKTVDIHAKTDNPLILIGKTETGVEVKYLLAPLIMGE